jgi:hypothetical protein
MGLSRVLAKKIAKQKDLLAMTIESDTGDGCGVSRGSISRNYESVGILSVYPYFKWLLRSALRGHRLPFQRDSGERSVYSQ